MILTTRFTFIVEWSWKNMHFHPKLAWLPATYDVISRNHSNWLSLNLTQNLREGWANSYWKRQVLIFYPLGKISEGLMGWGWHPTSLPLLVRPRVKKCRSVILKERDTVNSTVKLSTWRHLTNQSMMPESGIMERRHQRHVARLRRSFSVPIFLFDPVFCLPPPPSPPLRSPIPGYSPSNIASYLQSLDSAAFPLLQCSLGKLWHNTSRQTSKTPK